MWKQCSTVVRLHPVDRKQTHTHTQTHISNCSWCFFPSTFIRMRACHSHWDQTVNVWCLSSEAYLPWHFFVCLCVFLSAFRSSVAEISWGPNGQVNMLVLCKHRLPNMFLGIANKLSLDFIFFIKTPRLFLLTDWVVTSLLRRSSIGPSGAAGWQAAGAGPSGGGKQLLFLH